MSADSGASGVPGGGQWGEQGSRSLCAHFLSYEDLTVPPEGLAGCLDEVTETADDGGTVLTRRRCGVARRDEPLMRPKRMQRLDNGSLARLQFEPLAGSGGRSGVLPGRS